MLIGRYMTSVKNLGPIFQKIVEGAAPTKFTISHLKGLGFNSSNDVGVLALLKDLGFLTADGAPTARYHAYRDRTQSAAVLGEAVREVYGDLFLINENLSEKDRVAVEGKFKQVHNVTDRVAGEQAKTFFALLKLADMSKASKGSKPLQPNEAATTPASAPPATAPNSPGSDMGNEAARRTHDKFSLGGLRYNIEIHLPATKDIEVFNAIFKSLKEHLLEH